MAGRKILWVEGKDDEHVLKHICGNRGVPDLDEVKPLGDVEQLSDAISIQLKLGYEGDIVGVVLDADTDIRARWQSLRDRVREAGYEHIPDLPLSDGTIMPAKDNPPLPRLGMWIMPDNQADGTLEDFLRFLVPQPHALFDHVKSSVAEIPMEFRQSNVSWNSKAIIHTWLAWQETPGKPLGTAITARFLNPSVPEVDGLVSWLRRLFFS